MNVEIFYQCPQCGESSYGSIEEAEACCPNTANEIFGCGKCEEKWDNHEDAEVCCQT